MSHGTSFIPNNGTLLSLLLCSMLVIMGGAAVAPSLPLINEVFEGQDFYVSLIITLPSLSVAITGFMVGALADRFGKVRVLLVSLTLFTITGVSSFFLNDLMVILVMRFFVGVGIAGITCTITALIAEYYAGMKRAKVMSYQSAATGVGVLILEYTGGSLATLGWHYPFLVYLIGIPMILLVLLFMREPFRDGSEDMVHEVARPANKGLIIACYVTMFVMMCMAFLIPTKIPYFLAEIGVTTDMVGLLIGVHGVVNAVTCLFYRRFIEVTSSFMLMGLGFLLWGFALMMLLISPTLPAAVVMLVVSGVGMGMACPAIVNTLAGEATSSNSGKIMGGYSMALNLGQFSISLISVPLFVLAGNSYPTMYAIMGIVAFIAAVIYLGYCAVKRSADTVPRSKKV